MRALRLLALAATLVVPAAAAHAQFGVYAGPSVRYAAPAYGDGGYWVPGHWSYDPGSRYWSGTQWRAEPRHYFEGRQWREHRDWDRRGRRRDDGRRW